MVINFVSVITFFRYYKHERDTAGNDLGSRHLYTLRGLQVSPFFGLSFDFEVL